MSPLCSFLVDFKSAKTVDVIRKVGLHRLLLETDHEDASRVPNSMEQSVTFVAKTLEVDRDEVIRITTSNAFDFYGLES